AAKGVGPLPRHEAEHLGGAARRVDDAREHFQRSRLAGAVGAEEGHHLARLDREADAVHRPHFLVPAAPQPADRAQEAGLLLKDAIRLRQVPRLYDRHAIDSRHETVRFLAPSLYRRSFYK